MKGLSFAVAVLLAGCGGAPKSTGPGQPPEEEPQTPAAPDAGGKAATADAAVAGKSDGPAMVVPDAAIAADSASPGTDSGAGGAGGAGGASGTSGLAQMLLSRAIGLGYYHSCLITPNHDVQCRGDVGNAGDPRIHPPAGLKAEQISGAHNGFCVLPVGTSPALPGEPETLPAIVRGRKLTCWGHNPSFFPPANLEMDPIQYGVGYDHGCVLNADHSVLCWGQGGTNFKAPDGLRAKSLTVASFFNCAIKEDDSVVCWGINPPAPPAGLKAKLVAATFHGNNKLPEAPGNPNHACAIKLDDTVTCWGSENGGNLAVPAGLGPVRDLAVATVDSCAVRMNGEPVCWGNVKYNMSPTRYHPQPPGLRLKAIRAKLATYCGIKMEDDTVVCWGDEQHDHITFPAAGVKLYVPAN
jgi:hypothetical protein